MQAQKDRMQQARLRAEELRDEFPHLTHGQLVIMALREKNA